MQSSSAARRADFLIIGAGIAGGVGRPLLAPHGRTILLERESQPGYHSTGRSAALFMESYGTPQVRALTLASRAFFDAPPAGLHRRIRCCAARRADGRRATARRRSCDEHWEVLRSDHRRAAAARCRRGLRARAGAAPRTHVLGAVFEPDAADMDVHAIHQGFLRGIRAPAARWSATPKSPRCAREGGLWQVQAGRPALRSAGGGQRRRRLGRRVAQLAGVAPIGLQPKRRSAFIFAPPEGVDIHAWPLRSASTRTGTSSPTPACCSARRPTPIRCQPHDVQPEELDIALAIDRIER